MTTGSISLWEEEETAYSQVHVWLFHLVAEVWPGGGPPLGSGVWGGIFTDYVWEQHLQCECVIMFTVLLLRSHFGTILGH